VKLIALFLACTTGLYTASCSAPTERAPIVSCMDSPDQTKPSKRTPKPKRAKHKRPDSTSDRGSKPEVMRIDDSEGVAKPDVVRLVVDKPGSNDGSHEAEPSADVRESDEESDSETGESDHDATNDTRDDDSDTEVADLEQS
jgi:hypothetical protein